MFGLSSSLKRTKTLCSVAKVNKIQGWVYCGRNTYLQTANPGPEHTPTSANLAHSLSRTCCSHLAPGLLEVPLPWGPSRANDQFPFQLHESLGAGFETRLRRFGHFWRLPFLLRFYLRERWTLSHLQGRTGSGQALLGWAGKLHPVWPVS